MIAFDVSNRSGCLQFACSFPFPEIPDLELIASADEHIQLFVEMHGVDVGVSVEGRQELALLQTQSIDFVYRCRDTEVCIVGAVFQISREMRNSGLVMSSVLSVEIDRAIVLRHHYLAVVVRENLEFYHFAVHSPEALQRQLGSVVYLYLRGVDAGSHYVALVSGYFDLVGGDLELEILDEFDPPAILLVVAQRFAIFLRVRQELRVGLSRRHVVGLHPVDFRHLVHQQSVLYAIFLIHHTPTLTIYAANYYENR